MTTTTTTKQINILDSVSQSYLENVPVASVIPPNNNYNFLIFEKHYKLNLLHYLDLIY